MSVNISGSPATPHSQLRPDRAAYRMKTRTYQAAADARSRRVFVSTGYRVLGTPEGESVAAVLSRVSDFTAALSAAGRRPDDNADPYPFRDGS